MLWRQVKAKVLARRGEHAEAERLAREAVAIGDETDMLDAQGDAYADLAEVLLLAGKPDEAAGALEQALERYERKGNLVSAERARTRSASSSGRRRRPFELRIRPPPSPPAPARRALTARFRPAG